NLAIFAFIDVLERTIGSTEIPDYAGLGKQFPVLFSCFTFVGIALVGLPPTAGFIGKILVFTAVFEGYHIANEVAYILLLIVGALTSVISLFYYFKIPLYALLRKGDEVQYQAARTSTVLGIGILLSALLLLLGIFPNILLSFF